LLQHLRLAGAMGEANGLQQNLRVVGILVPVAGQRRQRLLIEAEGLDQPQQTEHRVSVPAVVAERLAVFLHGPLELAKLLGRGSHQPVRDAVVRPQADSLFEYLQGLGGVAARQEQATPQQIPHDR
jgi:hypothetical protein